MIRTKRDRTIARNIVKFYVRQLRSNQLRSNHTPNNTGNLWRFLACRHRAIYSHDPIPVPIILQPTCASVLPANPCLTAGYEAQSAQHHETT